MKKKDVRKRNRRRETAMHLGAVALVLLVFCLVYVAEPKEGAPIKQTAASSLAVYTPAPAEGATLPPPKAESTAEATPAPTPVPTAEGDFSTAFPTESTGGGLFSYQREDLRIAVDMVQEDGVTYFIADVWVRDIRTFSTAFAQNRFRTGRHEVPVKMAMEHKAVLAVTGDYCGARREGLVIRNGELYRDSVQGDVCILYLNGEMATYTKEEFSLSEVLEKRPWQGWEFGPALLQEGQAIETFDSAIANRHPRNAIGYYAPGHYCFVTVDGRQKGYSKGMSLQELSQLFFELGCKTAYNLDGGATAQMMVEGELINKPYKGGRECGDIIFFGGEGQ